MFQYQAPNPYPKPTNFFACCKPAEPPCESSVYLPHVLHAYDAALLSSRYRVGIETGIISTHDYAKLDTVVITPQTFRPEKMSEKKYIIKFCDENQNYQMFLNHYAQDAQKLRTTIIGFNYRNQGESKCSPSIDNPTAHVSFTDLVIDGIAQINRLISNSVPAASIVLEGRGLGGAVATLVASYFHQRSHKVFLLTDGTSTPIEIGAAYKKIPFEYKAELKTPKLSISSPLEKEPSREEKLEQAAFAEEARTQFIRKKLG